MTIEKGGARRQGPVVAGAPVELGGFWIVEAENDEAAYATAERGQAACGQRLEVRRLQG